MLLPFGVIDVNAARHRTDRSEAAAPGMIGGGQGAYIGGIHRFAARSMVNTTSSRVPLISTPPRATPSQLKITSRPSVPMDDYRR